MNKNPGAMWHSSKMKKSNSETSGNKVYKEKQGGKNPKEACKISISDQNHNSINAMKITSSKIKIYF